MNDLTQAEEELRLAERLVSSLKWDYKHGRATVFELERALIALERVDRKHTEELLKELGVWGLNEAELLKALGASDSLEPIN